ncbi:MAG: transcription-repair coupling factor [Parachlamydiales bacterium]
MAGKPLISKKLLSSPSLEAFEQFSPKEPSILIEELWDAPKAALIYLLLQSTKKNILVISSGSEDRLYQDISTLSGDSVLEFPSWETLPGEEILPSPDIVGKRFDTLFELLNKKKPSILISSLQACLQKLPSPKLIKPLCQSWKSGDEINFSSLPEKLTQMGYRRAPVVSDKGEFALRGGILDLFPISSFDPYRIEFFGDAIEQIRTFDPISQKSIQKVDRLFLPPASELELLKQDPKPSSLIDYVGSDLLVIFNNLLAIEDRYVAIKKMPSFGGKYFASLEELFEKCQRFPVHFWAEHPIEELSDVQISKKAGRRYYSGKEPLQSLSFQVLDQEITTKRWQHPFREVGDFFSLSEDKAASTGSEILHGIHRFAKSNIDLHFTAATEAEEHSLKERIAQEKISLPKNTHFDHGYLSSGFVVSDSQLACVPTTELTHRYKPRRQKWRNTYHTPASEFHELSPGDVVVHFHNGIAKYLGIEKRPNHTGQMTEFMVLEYSEKSKLFVPVSQSHLVSRYIGVKEEIPTLSTLGSPRWQKTRLQAQQAIIGYADQLLRMNAARALHGGFIFGADSKEMQLFEADFPFVETEDQLQAIDGIKADMSSAKAMDRLICGDVGYGKTEVAMRAAFKAVADGKKQVAVLVPTTVLAMQHYETFCDRMANFPVNIGVVSRFRSAKEVKETLKKVEEGSIDILIGTHRIISKDVRFKDLGLIIIDEEQRFGVRAKEHLKTLKTGVDCITLSATPIPRTLYMSLIGAKEISVINTPPQDRLPIKSLIAERESGLIQNALLRELSRDGQAYMIHNRVETIFKVSDELQKLLPQARIVVGHGQMSSDELDTVFHAFKSGEADILIATTIIENGIDIPNANTILIDRADTFGLADLYQMRGRVGRWNRPAYAYFLVPHRRELPELSRKRLQALVEASGYGGGMKIAMRDLEIRGAGDILGTQQSGHVSTVGFHLYCKLLKKAIEALRNKSSPSFTETKMEFSYPASLPEEYINEGSLRMEIYHRLGEATSFQEVDGILAELKDRFGPYPQEVLWLYHLTRLRLFASQRHFTLLKFENLTFTAERQEGKETVKKTLALPRTKKPDEWEKQVVEQLSQAFTFSRRK